MHVAMAWPRAGRDVAGGGGAGRRGWSEGPGGRVQGRAAAWLTLGVAAPGVGAHRRGSGVWEGGGRANGAGATL